MRVALAAAAFAVSVLIAPDCFAQAGEFEARVRAGEVECYTPDRVARTCRAMSTYRQVEGGGIINDAIVLVQNNPNIIMYVSSDVFVRDDMICGRVERRDLDAARFEIDGVRATEEEAGAIRAALWEVFRELGEICSLYTPDGEGFSVRQFIDGVEQPDYADRMIWVRPGDSYTIGAAESSPT